jgi:hypothetical protein
MDLRAKEVWLPGLASCGLFFAWYSVLNALPFFKDRSLMISLPYLAVTPFAGALGAFLSRRAKGSSVDRILSALFPVFTLAALFPVRIVYGLFFEGVPYTFPHFLEGLVMAVKFVTVGGLLLLLGAWPFCRASPGEQPPR